MQQQKISIPIYYKIKEFKCGFKKYIILPTKKDEDSKKVTESELALPEDKKTIHLVNTTWKILNWREGNQTTRDSQVTNMEGRSEIDWVILRDLRLKKALTGWDFKDEKGNLEELNEKAIDELPNELVLGFLNKYDEIIGVEDEDEKKVT